MCICPFESDYHHAPLAKKHSPTAYSCPPNACRSLPWEACPKDGCLGFPYDKYAIDMTDTSFIYYNLCFWICSACFCMWLALFCVNMTSICLLFYIYMLSLSR